MYINLTRDIMQGLANIKYLTNFRDQIIGISIGSGTSFLLGTASVWSTQLRCSMVLILPSLFSGRGRALLMTLGTGVLIDGPIATINYNSKELIK